MWGAVAKGIGGAIVGEVAVNLALNTGAFDKGVKQSTKSAEKQYSKSFNNIGNAGTQMFSKLTRMATAFISIGALVKFGKQAIQLGSDLQEVQNVVDVTFGSMSKHVNEFANNTIETAGLSETVAKKYMGTFGAMSKQFGFTTEESYKMSKSITQLTGDVASFYNLSTDEAYTKLKSIWTGETETLKEIGVVMTQNALDQYALANGYGKTTAKMTEQEKVALRYAFVQNKLSLASGDFIRTQDGWANQTRVLTLRWQQFMATVGQGLINVLTPLVKMLNLLMSKLQAFANTFKSFTASLFGDANKGSGSKGVSSTLTNINDGLSGIGTSANDSAKDVANASKKINRSLAGVDELNVLNTSKDDSAGGSGSGISDQMLGSGGIGSGIVDTGALNGTEEKINKITRTAYEWGSIIGETINKGLEQIPWVSIQEKVNSAISTMAQFLNGAIKGLNWNLMGSTIGDGFNTILFGLNTFLKEFDWGELGKGLVDGINGLIASVDFKMAGELLKNGLNGAIDFMWNAVTTFDAKNAGEKLADLINGISDAIKNTDWKKLGQTVSEGLHKVIEFLRTWIKKTDWGELVKNIFDGIEKFIGGIDWGKLLSDLGGLLIDVGAALVDGLWEGIKWCLSRTLTGLYKILVKPIIDKVKDLFGIHSPSTVFAEIGGFLIEGLWNGIKGLKNWLIKKWDGVKSWFGNIVKSVGVKVSEIPKAVKEKWNQTKDWFKGKTENIKAGVEDLKQSTKDKWNRVKSWFTGKEEKIKITTEEASTSVKNKWNQTVSWFKGKEEKVKVGVQSATTGDKTKWNNVLNNFKGKTVEIKAKVGGVVGNFKSSINENLIRPLNKKLPKMFPKIPLLAQGGWLPANNPQLAIVGDNKREPEIVSPESKIYEQTYKAVKDAGGSVGKQQLEITIYHKYEDGRTIIQKVNQAQIDEGKILLLT